jgi:hypothetical protein
MNSSSSLRARYSEPMRWVDAVLNSADLNIEFFGEGIAKAEMSTTCSAIDRFYRRNALSVMDRFPPIGARQARTPRFVIVVRQRSTLKPQPSGR